MKPVRKLSTEALGGPACKAVGETREFREYQQRGVGSVGKKRSLATRVAFVCWICRFPSAGVCRSDIPVSKSVEGMKVGLRTFDPYCWEREAYLRFFNSLFANSK